MKLFVPEWADMVDPEFNFLTEQASVGHRRDRWSHDRRVWEFFGPNTAPVDGVLVSRLVFDRSGAFRQNELTGRSLREFLRLPRSLDLMGDCGAFGYVNHPRPPYGPHDTLEFYRKAGVDVGVTVDHLIVRSIVPPDDIEPRPLSEAERRERWALSLKNALTMFELWSGDERYWSAFRLMGAIQGETVEDYQRAASILVSAGFTYLGIGGLVRLTSDRIARIVSGVSRTIREHGKPGSRVDLHLFGVARPDLFHLIRLEGVSSIDSATMLRRAWMSDQNNYSMEDGTHYTALRLPRQLKHNEVIRRLQVLREFDGGGVAVDRAMEVLLATPGDQANARRKGFRAARNFETDYARTLRDQPWKSCPCPICMSNGIDVVVFRGNDRNRRRGFHNTFVFHTLMRRVIPHVAIVLSCSKRKRSDPRPLPAILRYSGSPIFAAAFRAVGDLRLPDLLILSGRYGLIDSNAMIPDYDAWIRDEDWSGLRQTLRDRLGRYAKVFFYGAGRYRTLFQELSESDPGRYRILPSHEYSHGRRLDVIELQKQIAFLRSEVLQFLGLSETSPGRITVASSEKVTQSVLPL